MLHNCAIIPVLKRQRNVFCCGPSRYQIKVSPPKYSATHSIGPQKLKTQLANHQTSCFTCYLISFQIQTNVSVTLVNMEVLALTESMVTLALVLLGMRVLLVEQVSCIFICPFNCDQGKYTQIKHPTIV